MNRLTAEYIVELFESVKDCQSKSDWEHNKKRFTELIKEYGTEQCNIANVSNNEVELKAFVEEFIKAWEDGMGGDSSLYDAAKRLL